MNEDAVYPVICPSCGYFGMREDCSHGECPWCGRRVVRDMLPEIPELKPITSSVREGMEALERIQQEVAA